MIAANYKTIGTSVTELNDDFYLTIVGSLSSVMNFLTRLFWGNMLDKFSFRKLWIANIILTLFVTLSM